MKPYGASTIAWMGLRTLCRRLGTRLAVPEPSVLPIRDSLLISSAHDIGGDAVGDDGFAHDVADGGLPHVDSAVVVASSPHVDLAGDPVVVSPHVVAAVAGLSSTSVESVVVSFSGETCMLATDADSEYAYRQLIQSPVVL